MDKENSSSKESTKPKNPETFLRNSKGKKFNSQSKTNSSSSNQEVLIKVGGFEYKTPGRKQRVIIGSIVIGLNLLLVIATLVYFNNPAFQQFIYNVGRN